MSRIVCELAQLFDIIDVNDDKQISRDEFKKAITKMERALGEYIIEGVKTTIPFHQKLMRHERFRSGDFTTKFLEEETV